MARFSIVFLMFLATALLPVSTRHSNNVTVVDPQLVLAPVATTTGITDIEISNRVAFWSPVSDSYTGFSERATLQDDEISPLLDQLFKRIYGAASYEALLKQQETSRELCSAACLSILEQFRQNQTFTDDQLAQALGNIDEMVAVLKDAPQLQQEFIEMALHSSSGNVREAILSAFAQLAPEAQRSLGRALVSASDGRQRFDGVQLLARIEVMDESVATELEQVYATEDNEYVRTAVVKALNHPALLRNNPQALNFLTYVMDTDTEAAVRGEALIVSVELSDDTEFALTRSLAAIRSSTENYPAFGARALTTFLERNPVRGSELEWQYTQDIDYLMSEMMSPDYDHLPSATRTQIDNMYDRFF